MDRASRASAELYTTRPSEGRDQCSYGVQINTGGVPSDVAQWSQPPWSRQTQELVLEMNEPTMTAAALGNTLLTNIVADNWFHQRAPGFGSALVGIVA